MTCQFSKVIWGYGNVLNGPKIHIAMLYIWNYCDEKF